nr:HIT domain-containing protein [Chloroflexia bacterium]
PYNTGHLMLVPNAHVASPEESEPSVLAEIAIMKAPLLRALRRVLNCDGFNLGTNVGAVAGAGITDHLHEHIVPRWQGDANFMPVLAATMVLPELIPVTYAKIRAEVARELRGQARMTCLVFAENDSSLLVKATRGGMALPTADALTGQAHWRAAHQTLRQILAGQLVIAGWGGSPDARDADIALSYRYSGNVEGALPKPYRWVPIADSQIATTGGGEMIAAAVATLRLYGRVE